MHDGSLASATARYSKKREAIVAAATEILNQKGVKGMTLAGVAEQVGLITTSVTYYFKRKDELAAACFLAGLERLQAMVEDAAERPTAEERIGRLLQVYLAERRRVVEGQAPPIPVFSDIRALSAPYVIQVAGAYRQLFRSTRELLTARGGIDLDRRTATARAEILLEQVHWINGWVHRYEPDEYVRIGERMQEILIGGLAAPDAEWAPARLADTMGPGPGDGSRETFLRAATQLINQYGYRGASVEKISQQLNVTKGSFYHHHNAKDDLVVDCFERSYDFVRRAQAAARALPGSQWLKLSSAVSGIVEHQLSGQGPLLRFSALAALPEGMRDVMVEHAGRVADRFASIISDGIAEGAIRPVDPIIAAQMIMGAVNAAADLQALLQGKVTHDEVAFLYARPTLSGLLVR
jgi:AcrR family transcriptional regulator